MMPLNRTQKKTPILELAALITLTLGATASPSVSAQSGVPAQQPSADKVRWEFGFASSLFETSWKGLSAQSAALPFVNAEVGSWRFGPKYGIAQYQISMEPIQYAVGVGYRDESYESDWIPGFKKSDATELEGYKSGGGDLTLLAQVQYQRLALKLEQDVSDNSNGLTAEVKVEHPLYAHGLGWNLKTSVGVYWQSEDYVRHLYGIRGSNIDASKGRTAYAPNSALNPFVSINTSYIFDPRWGVHGFYRFEYLDDTIIDSPIIDEKNKQALGLILTYRM